MPLTRAQVREVDRIAVEQFGMTGLVLMENAGRNAAQVCLDAFEKEHPFIIVCGTGNNGGDGCVMARHLHNAGRNVTLLAMGAEDRRSGDLRSNLNILRKMRVPIIEAFGPGDLFEISHSRCVLIDAILGTGFQGEVRDEAAAIIQTMMSVERHAVVAVDIPSGLDADSGEPSNAAVRADITLTFVDAKIGFTMPSASAFVGRVEVIDIGVPVQAIEIARGAVPPKNG